MGKVIAVTGGTGFIGSHLIERLVAEGYTTRCLVLPGERYDAVPGASYHTGDITDSSSLDEFLQGIDTLIHLAGLTRARTEDEFIRVNAEAAAGLVEAAAARSTKLSHVIAMSSLAAAGPAENDRGVCEDDPLRPITPYGRSKARLEELLRCKESLADWTVIRAPAVYGPRDKDFLAYYKLIKKGWRFVIGRRSVLSLVYVHNLVDALVRCIERPEARNQAFFIADEGRYDWDDLGAMVEGFFGKKARRVRVPFWAVRIVAGINQARMPWCKAVPLLNRHKLAEMSQTYWVVSTEKAKAVLGFTPKYQTVSALHETGHWYRERGLI